MSDKVKIRRVRIWFAHHWRDMGNMPARSDDCRAAIKVEIIGGRNEFALRRCDDTRFN